MSYAVSIEKPQAERPRSPKTTDRSNDIWDNIVVRCRTHDSLTSHPKQKQPSFSWQHDPPHPRSVPAAILGLQYVFIPRCGMCALELSCSR